MAFSKVQFTEYRGYRIELFNSLSETVLVKDSYGRYLKAFDNEVLAIEWIDRYETAIDEGTNWGSLLFGGTGK